jgi:hypothetical protein
LAVVVVAVVVVGCCSGSSSSSRGAAAAIWGGSMLARRVRLAGCDPRLIIIDDTSLGPTGTRCCRAAVEVPVLALSRTYHVCSHRWEKYCTVVSTVRS